MINHHNKTAVITGSARGIGRAIANALAKDGANVAILDINAQGAKATAEAIKKEFNVRTWSAELNVMEKENVLKVFQELDQKFGQSDILVNNAGITTNVHTITEMPMENWDKELSINLSGAFYCIKQVLPSMIKKKWGRIVNISSLAGASGGYGQCSYASSKAGLLGLTKTIALECARYNITANAVLPGLVNTDAAAAIPENLRQRIANTSPGRRMAEPSEIANVVSFLASQEASYMNGAEIFVTAGAELFTF